MNAETIAPLNIYQRLNVVRKAVEYVRKDKKVEGQSYMVVTHDAVTALVRPHLVEQNVMVVPVLLQSKVSEAGTTAKGTPIIRYEGLYEVAFVNGDLPEDRVVVKLESHALDQGDKAPGKAISYAVKYAMLKLFSLETGEDEEQRLEPKAKKETHSPSDGVEDSLSEPTRNRMLDVATVVQDFANSEKWEEAYAEWEKTDFNGIAEAKIYAWKSLASTTRSKLKRMKQEKALKAQALEAAATP